MREAGLGAIEELWGMDRASRPVEIMITKER